MVSRLSSWSFALVLAAGCGDPGSFAEGELSLQLRSVDGTANAYYTLRDESFTIYDAEGDVVAQFAEDEDDRFEIVRLPPGDYTIELTGPWYFDYVSNGTATRDDTLELESQNPLAFTIEPGRTTAVTFKFGRGNGVAVGFEVEGHQLMGAAYAHTVDGLDSTLLGASIGFDWGLSFGPRQTHFFDVYDLTNCQADYEILTSDMAWAADAPESLGLMFTPYQWSKNMLTIQRVGGVDSVWFVLEGVTDPSATDPVVTALRISGTTTHPLPTASDGCVTLAPFELADATWRLDYAGGYVDAYAAASFR